MKQSQVNGCNVGEQRSDIEGLRSKVRELEERLSESDETLRAIRSGEVDAIMVSTDKGERIFTLKGAEEPYRVLFEQMNEGAVTVTDDGTILYANQSFAKAIQLSLERIIGTSIENFFHPSDISTYHSLLRRGIDRPVRGDLKLQAMNGAIVPMHVSVTHLPSVDDGTYCIVMADLTEHFQAEEALRKAYDELDLKVQDRTRELSESEARYRAVFDNSLDAILLTCQDGRILSANPAAQRMFGMTEEELRRAGPERLIVHEEELNGAFEEHKENGKARAELTYRRKDGAKFLGEVTSGIFLDADGSEKISTIIRDITERKKGEDALAMATEELKRSNAELQQFAYVASHDMQEPLRMVTSYLDLLNHKFGDELNPKAKEYTAFAVDGAVRMRELVNDLLTYSRVDSRPMKMEEVDLNKVLAKVMDDLHIAISESKAEIMVGPLPTIHADESKIKQVFQNLISNAIKFHGTSPPKVEVTANSLGSEWKIAVQDNGIGIDPRYRERIFEMFQRLHTKEEYPGTGIGLAITKKIVERHGGKIWVESVPGEGSTFFITIPA